MAFQYLTNAPLNQAVQEYLEQLRERGFGPAGETVPIGEACGRITARAVYAHICAPHYHACAMDGIALRAADTFGAGETTPVFLPEGKYTVVDTGDPLPPECDAVIMVEELEWAEGGVRIYAAATPWQNVRQIGEDICAGEMLLPADTEITPSAIGAMIAAGVLEVEVVRRPVVGIIPTGDEIVPPTADPAPGDILEFNSAIFSAMLQGWGAQTRVYPIVKDKLELIRSALEKAAAECDVVLLNAGSSAGREDYSAQAIAQVGEVLFHGIAMKPGKPAILGCRGAVPILGVPGYPVSGIIVLEHILRPVLDECCRAPIRWEEREEAVLTRPVVSTLKYQEFVRVRMGYVGDKLMASPLGRGSGVVTSFMRADGILEVPQNVEGYPQGEKVSVRLLRPREQLRRSVVVIGSHDPLLDELGDLLHSADRSMFMSSSHVGSMGGITAIKRGEAHLAGIHLLDEKDGSYNIHMLKKNFPRGGVRLVECVGRVQGLMAAPGNPLGIRGIADLARENLRYVNRQKGSGTRILIDYLCRQAGVDTGKIYGYDREEFTHTSVAAQVASGSADAGLGILSAAKLYDLDFIPVYNEQYDLLIPDAAWETPMVQRLLEILQGPAFRARLEALGGYRLEHPGTVRFRLEPVSEN